MCSTGVDTALAKDIVYNFIRILTLYSIGRVNNPSEPRKLAILLSTKNSKKLIRLLILLENELKKGNFVT